MLCSSCNKKELLLSNNTFLSSGAFLWQVSSLQFRLSLLFAFCFPSESSCFIKFSFWQEKILKWKDSRYRRSIGKRGDIELLSLTDIMFSLSGETWCHSIEYFWYWMPQLSKNLFYCLPLSVRWTHWPKRWVSCQFLSYLSVTFLYKKALCCPGIVLSFMLLLTDCLEEHLLCSSNVHVAKISSKHL